MTVLMMDIERVVEDEIAAGAKQKSVALSYAFGLRSDAAGIPIDWKRINAAIVARWPKGLARVKERAWRIYQGQEQP